MKNIKKVGIVGLGFMGGSFAVAFKKEYPQTEIYGFARNNKSYDKLSKLNIVDKVSMSIEDVVSLADIIVLALPVQKIVSYFKIIKPYLKRNSVVLDLGSTKAEIENQAAKILPKTVDFIGCHPLAGSEKSGAEFSNSDLYKGAICVITAPSKKKSVREVKKLWENLGSQVVFMKASLHDKALSTLSHFPHLISFAITLLVSDEYVEFSPRSIQELTRISNSPPNVWSEIFLANRGNIGKDIKKFKKILEQFEGLIKTQNAEGLVRLLLSVNRKQANIQANCFSNKKNLKK